MSTARKRQNHYLLEQAKKSEQQKQASRALSQSDVTTLLLRMETKAQFFSVVLLASLACLPAPAAAAKKPATSTCIDKECDAFNTTKTGALLDKEDQPLVYRNPSDASFFKIAQPLAPTTKEQKPSYKKRAAQLELDALIIQMESKIIHTDGAKEIYKSDKRFSADITKKLLVKAARTLAKEAAVFCKLKFTLDNGLTFFMSSELEVEAQQQQGLAVFSSPTKRIYIPVTELTNPANANDLETILRHELHHAFISLQNFKQERFLTHKKTAASTTPCYPSLDKMECKELARIIKQGIETTSQLLNLFAHATSEKNKLMDDYLEAYQHYKLRDNNDNPSTPLVRFLTRFNQYSQHFDLSSAVVEWDAVIVEIFEHAPPLLDFLFPGLREYHAKRTDSTYQACMRPS